MPVAASRAPVSQVMLAAAPQAPVSQVTLHAHLPAPGSQVGFLVPAAASWPHCGT